MEKNTEWRLSEKYRNEDDALFLKGSSRSGRYIRIDGGTLSGGKYIERIPGRIMYEESFSKEFESCDGVWDHLLANTGQNGDHLARLLFERFTESLNSRI